MKFQQIKDEQAIMLAEKVIAQYDAMQESIKSFLQEGKYCQAKKTKKKATFIMNRAGKTLDRYIQFHRYHIGFNEYAVLNKLSHKIYNKLFVD